MSYRVEIQQYRLSTILDAPKKLIKTYQSLKQLPVAMPPEGLITCGHGYMHIFTHRACEQRQANTLLQHVVVPLLAHLLLEVWAL